MAIRPSKLDEKIATFDPAEIAKTGAKSRDATRVTGRGHKTQEADTGSLGLLCARPERPRRRRAANKRDELAAFQLIELHSIRVLISSHRKLLSSEATAVSVVETSGHDFGQLPSGSSFVLDRANDRREYGAASASSDRLRDNAAYAQIARLCCGRDRWQQ
jgi:hypothetical protein